MDRRSFVKMAGSTAGLFVASSVAGGAESCCGHTSVQGKLQFNNADFYSNGKFQVEKAKDAIVAVCRHHGYGIFPGFRDKLWVSDYDAGQFAKLGLAAYMFCNNVEDRYMLMDLFLLPGQMLPEHWHLEADGNPAKREGWLVRAGLSHIVGIGEDNLSKDIVIPKFHCGGTVSTRHEVAATAGMFVPLAKVGAKHWQYGGPEGAVITEVANVHTDAGVRHADPALNEYFLSLSKKK